MAEADPVNQEEWIERYYRSYRVVGSGLNVASHVPCPFCASPGFQVLDILTADEDILYEAACTFCGRSGKVIPIGDNEWEFVQTSGEDPPPYLLPVMRLPRE